MRGLIRTQLPDWKKYQNTTLVPFHPIPFEKLRNHIDAGARQPIVHVNVFPQNFGATMIHSFHSSPFLLVHLFPWVWDRTTVLSV
jgi:hypothetical protein